jgi:glycosyltransferase involved in cell wall biosynthesis
MNNNKIKKEKIILNVGRFFSNSGENHYKCQDKLLESFKEMTNLHESGWRLCLIGSVADDIDSLKYLLNLYRESQNYPVDIITNAPFSVLKDYFAKASIYWHATGMGNNENEHPEKQEHFGITTVEAMSAGAVPVVINAAGQKETIIHQKNGFLWNNEEELANYTKKIAEDNTLFLDMSKSSITSSKQFNKQSFEKILSEIIKQL